MLLHVCEEGLHREIAVELFPLGQRKERDLGAGVLKLVVMCPCSVICRVRMHRQLYDNEAVIDEISAVVDAAKALPVGVGVRRLRR